MAQHISVWYPDVDFVESRLVRLVPVLFPEYDEGVPNFQYLGGQRGRALLESALAQPRQSFGGEDLYPSLSAKAAALIWSITNNHPYIDGNKRAALTTATFFLGMNHRIVVAAQSEQVLLCLKVASGGAGIDRDYVIRWLESHSVSISDFPKPEVQARLRDFSVEELRAFLRFSSIIVQILTELEEHLNAKPSGYP